MTPTPERPSIANTIVIIPARGGSKGIPRKNLRPLAGKPLIQYAIEAARSCSLAPRVVVTTEDEEIALISGRLGAHVIPRPPELANDTCTLDPVIAHAVAAAEQKWDERYEFVVTVQPTSPLVRSIDIEQCIDKLAASGADTIISVVDDRHLNWTIVNDQPTPLYDRRVNRQQLPPTFRETGAIIGCRREQLASGTRIGTKIALFEIDKHRSFDIDSLHDLYLCEAILTKKRIVFAVVGYPEVGLGHVYRALMLANALVTYDLHFVCESSSKLAIDVIQRYNYSVTVCEDGNLADTILALGPDLIVNDILDTTVGYIERLATSRAKIVNFEDLGPGADRADLVINALYPHQLPSQRVLVGPSYFCLRDEFLIGTEKVTDGQVRRLLLTFGGVDEGDLTSRVLAAVVPVCRKREIAIDVVLGPGFARTAQLDHVVATLEASDVRVVKGTARISDYMMAADLAITSGGRTVIELAALRVPTIVICQNRREMTHTFASSDNGIVNLGYREDVTDEEIRQAVQRITEDDSMRSLMRSRMAAIDLASGKDRVLNHIKALLTSEEP